MKILFFANTSWNLVNFRMPLIQQLIEMGHPITALAPQDRFSPQLKAGGVSWIPIRLSQHGMNPFKELRTLMEVIHLYRTGQPDMVSHFTVKSVLYGSIAAHLLGIRPVINNITGLGLLFSDQRLSIRLLRLIVTGLYRVVLKGTTVIFQNPEDRHLFIEKKIVSETQSLTIRSSGVQVPANPTPQPENDAAILVIMPGRLVWTKGGEIFTRASGLVRAKYPNVRFVLVGEIPEHDPSALSKSKVQNWVQNGYVEWWGWKDDMASVYRQADIVCLPTLYGEGLPKSLLEAASHSRALIATDTPGCREIVQHEINGLLVPKNDAEALANAILRLAGDPPLRSRMGEKGREIVREHFSLDRIISQNLEIYLGQSKEG